MGELLAANGRFGDVVVDMEAGLEHLSRGTTRHMEVLYAVAEPYYRSLETAHRVTELAHELGIPEVFVIANKLRTDDERAAIRAFAERHHLSVALEVPHDPHIEELDRAGAPIVNVASGAALDAVRRLTDRLIVNA